MVALRKALARILVALANIICPEYQIKHKIEYGEATIEAENLAFMRGSSIVCVIEQRIN